MSNGFYNLASHSRQTIAFLGSVASAGSNRSKPFEVAVAYVLSRDLEIPVTPVDDIGGYYRLHHETVVFENLNALNEILPFYSANVRENITAFYKLRYYQLKPDAIPLALVKGQEVKDFFGLSRFLNNDIVETVENDGEKLCQFIGGLTEYFTEVKSRRLNESRTYTSSGQKDDFVPEA